MALEVFGIGYNKTGTTSLSVALGVLGYPCLHNPRDWRMRRILAGESFGYKAVCDYPCWIYWRQLAETFPGAKFILTVRSLESWLQSRRAHLARNRVKGKAWTVTNELQDSISYNKHIDDVQTFFRGSHSFLELNICEEPSWEKLTSLLNCPIPNRPFPHKNRTPYRKLRRKGIFPQKNQS